jgi:hypothetical protein
MEDNRPIPSLLRQEPEVDDFGGGSGVNEDSMEVQNALLRQHFRTTARFPRGTAGRGKVGRPPREGEERVDALSHWHRSIVDLQLEKPAITQREIAEIMEKTQPWISVVMGSDMFKAYQTERFDSFRKQKEETIIQKAGAVANKAFDILDKKMKNPGAVTINEAVSIAKVATATASVGNSGKGNGPVTNNNLTVLKVPAGIIEQSRARMRERAKELSSRRNTEGNIQEALDHIHLQAEGKMDERLGEDSFVQGLLTEDHPDQDYHVMIDVTPHVSK